MSNELKDIATKLCPYDSISDGWVIVSAEKRNDGMWNLVITPHIVEKKEESEGANDND